MKRNEAKTEIACHCKGDRKFITIITFIDTGIGVIFKLEIFLLHIARINQISKTTSLKLLRRVKTWGFDILILINKGSGWYI